MGRLDVDYSEQPRKAIQPEQAYTFISRDWPQF